MGAWFKRIPVLIAMLVMFAGILGVVSSLAQSEDDKSTFLKYVEEQISSDNFRISLNGLKGSLSSDVRFSSITISDKDGTWLTITKPRMVWTRTALLAGNLNIDSLTAESIEYLRNPLPDESLPDPEAKPFALPELPVSVLLETLKVDKVTFGHEVFGLAAEASVDGSIKLTEGSLDLDLDIIRQDGPGGELLAIANYNSEGQNLKLDVKITESENGIMANALNLEGNPAVGLSIVGNAPISELEVDLGFDVAENRILTGKLNLDGSETGTFANARLTGPLSTILPEAHRPFFGSTSDLNAQILIEDSGAIDIRSVNLNSGAVDMQANAYQLADGFLRSLNVKLALAPSDSERVELPVTEGSVSLAGLNMSVRYDATVNDKWDARIVAIDVEQDDLKIARANIDASGTLSNFNDPQKRSTSFEAFGKVAGFESKDTGLNEAIGREIQLYGTGNWLSGEPTQISALRVKGETFNLTSSGQLDGLKYTGSTSLDAQKLAAFSTLAGRNLEGRANIRSYGNFDILSGGFDMDIEGTTQELAIAQPSVDSLLKGRTNLSGGLARNENGLSFDNLLVTNKQFETKLNGRLASESADVYGNALIRNLNTLSDEAEGAVNLSLEISGTQKPFAVKSQLRMAEGSLQNRAVENLQFSFDGTLNDGDIKGEFGGTGKLNNKPVSLSADLNVADSAVSLKSLIAQITDTKIAGEFRRNETGLMDGKLDINSSDIGDVAALALVDASGELNGALDLFDTNDQQTAKADFRINRFRFQNYRIKSGVLVATAMDIFGQPKIGATINGKQIIVADTIINTLDAKVETKGTTTDFTVTASLDQNNAKIGSSGSVLQKELTNIVTLETLSLRSNITNAKLQSPATVVLGSGDTEISNAVLNVGSGKISVNGTAGDRLNLNVDVNSLPISIINAVRAGTNADGTVSGTIKVSGKPSAPAVSFDINGNRVTAAQLQEAGISPLSISANGQYGNETVRLNAMTIRNDQAIGVNANGTIPLNGAGLNIRANGSLPLSLASASLAERGASVTGNANFDVNVSGQLTAPNTNGSININGATFTDPLSNLKLTGIAVQANLTGDQVVINSGQANLSSGGSMRLGGSIGLTDNLPANIKIQLVDARYTDGQTFSTQASGNLAINGPLLRDPVLAGNINIGKTEISIPESFAGDADLLEVVHVQPNAGTEQTLARRERATPTPVPTARPSILSLDLTINAPNQIFIRGRGLDAELGGNIHVRGPVSNVRPTGRFELRRGRISILGQRIDLTEGNISLTGDFDPTIDLLAKTDAGDVDAFIRIQGRISNVAVTFSSSPELPQDEVLALIIFGRGISDLSPAQIVRLASVADELTGGNSPNLVDGIRQGSGLDDLDIVEDGDGNAAVKAGKYVSDNVYLGIQAGQKTEATINLDITDNVTARGSVSSEGDTSLGIFLEKDY